MKINEKQVKKMKIIFFIRNSLTSFHPEISSPLAGKGQGEGKFFWLRLCRAVVSVANLSITLGLPIHIHCIFH